MGGETVMVAWVTGGAVVASSVATGLLAFAGGRKNGQAAFITATHQAAELVIGQLRAEIARITGLWEQAEARYDQAIARLDAKDAEEERCQAELAELRDRFEEMVREEPVLPYRPGDLQRVGPKPARARRRPLLAD